jgi:Family of unknown function (DUF5871)
LKTDLRLFSSRHTTTNIYNQMSTIRPISIRSIDVNRVTFSVGPSKAGRNPSINFKYNDNSLQVLVPRIGFPGGVLIRDSDSGNTSYTLIGSLKGCDTYAKEHASESVGDIGKFYNFLIDLDERIISAAVENSPRWFGKKRSEEAIRDSYKRIVSVSTDKVDREYIPNGKYPPSFRVKVPVYDNKVATEVVDSSRNPVYVTPTSLVSVFPKGVEVNMVISGSIYIIAGGSFGVTWRLNSAQVFPRARVTARDIFADEDDAPDSESPTQEAPLLQDSQAVPAESTETGETQDEPAPPPAAPPRSKRRVAGGL